MNSQHSPARRLFALGGAAVTLTAIGMFLLQGPTSEAPSSGAAHEGPAASASPPARPERPGRAAQIAAPGRAPARNDGVAEAGETEEADDTDEAPASRRAQYTAALDRKIGRIQRRIAEDCAEHGALVHAFDDFAEVRDRIVESAVATDAGLKTKAEQRAFEDEQLRAFDTSVCRSVAGLSLSRECGRHFRACEHIL